MNNMSIGKKIASFVAIAIITGAFIGVAVLMFKAKQLKEDVYLTQNENLKKELVGYLEAKKTVGITNALSIANDGKIKDALIMYDREMAISSLKSISTTFKSHTPFKNIKIHIHSKNNTSFLRNWKPKKFGDDLSSFRHSVVSVNSSLKPANGFEIGKAGLSLRAVVPVIQDGNHLGSLEFMQGLNSVAKKFDKSKDAFLLLMDINKKVADPKPGTVFKNKYVISQKFVNKSFLAEAKNLNISELKKKGFITTANYLITFTSVKDFKGDVLGIALAGKNLKTVEEAINDANDIVYTSIVVLTIIMLLTLVIILYTLRRFVALPLERFEDGLLGFFKYVNKETNQVSQLHIVSNDEIGKMSDAINKNIVKVKDSIEADNRFINEVKGMVETIKNGYLNQRLDHKASSESLEELRVQMNEMLEALQLKVCTNINDLGVALDKYAALDFRHRIEGCSSEVTMGLNNLADTINKMLVENKQIGITLNDNANTLLDTVNDLNLSSNEAAARLEETAAAVEEITSNIHNSNERINEMSALAAKVDTSASDGEDLAKKTSSSMDEINEKVSAINEAISVIDQIAFQTNILSLNAAVEAATAGEAGKGFAVVAGEVRNLASRSAEAANEIKTLVEDANSKANDGKAIAADMIEGYDSLNNDIAKTIELISEVNGSSKEQQTGISQINDTINSLDQQTQKNAASADSANQIAKDTANIANDIVTSADEKEFIGKHDIKAKTPQRKTVDNTPSYAPPKTSAPTPKASPAAAAPQAPIQPIVSSNEDDDEWASF